MRKDFLATGGRRVDGTIHPGHPVTASMSGPGEQARLARVVPIPAGLAAFNPRRMAA